MDGMTRRDALAGLLAAAFGTAALGERSLAAALEDSGLAFASAVPFSFETLKANAAAQAREPWRDPISPYSDILEEIDYTAFHQISYRRDRALWRTGDSGAPVQLFHVGKYFKEPCSISLVESGQAREILYRQSYFEMSADHVARRLPRGCRLRRLPRHGRRPDLGLARLPRRLLFPHARRRQAVPACRRAGWRSTPPCRRRRNSRVSPPSGSKRCPASAAASSSTPCSTARA